MLDHSNHLGNQTGKNLGRIWPSYSQDKPEFTILKESKFIQKDLQAPTLDFLMLPTSRTYWHDHMQAPNSRTPSFLDSPPNTSTPACVFFKLQWQQLEWSSRCRKIFSLKTLSLCEGNLLKDLTRDSHKPQYEQPKTWLGFAFYI